MRRLAPLLRLSLHSALLLLAGALLLCTLAWQPVWRIAQDEAQARMQQVADALAVRVQRALDVGIPLARLEGVEALFGQRLQSADELLSLSLLDAQGQPLWRQQRGPALPPDAIEVRAPVRQGGQVVANVVAQAVPAGYQDFLRQGGWPLMAWGWLAVLCCAALALPYRRWRREQRLQAVARRIADGDLSVAIVQSGAIQGDARLAWIDARQRQLLEQHQRIERLVRSLQQTEPDASRRAAWEQALAEADAGVRWADTPQAAAAGAASAPPLRRRSLKTRITQLVVLIGLGLGLGFWALLWQRDAGLNQRYHDSVLHAQAIAWQQAQSEAVYGLQDRARQWLAQHTWAAAWRDPEQRAALAAAVAPALEQPAAGLRVDVFDGQKRMVYSTALSLQQEPLIEAGWLGRALQSASPVSGLSQVSRERYYLVAAQSFRVDGQAGVLAVGTDAALLLPALRDTLGGEVLLLNLRGRVLAGTAPLSPAFAQASMSVRQARVQLLREADGRYLLASLLPLQGVDQRQEGALLLLRDVSAEQRADRGLVLGMAFGGLAALLLLAGLVFLYLRHALAPLERSVGVLGALSHGDLAAAPDRGDEQLPNEAGQIARGVARLRGEMLNLQMLREERVRTRQRQEQIIRGELKRLAESLDEDARAEVLQALERPAGDNALAGLAHTLGRLSSLVTRQHGQLVDLLKELRQAMAQQAQWISLQQELDIARQMQLSILPRVTPLTPAVDVAALMVPAKEIGGDFYDFFMIDDHRLALVVADVSGKGVPAAFFMAISRTLLKANALFLREPGPIVERLNAQLCAENEQMMFVTLFLGLLDLRDGSLVYVNAGHNPPLLRSRQGAVRALPVRRNMALAVMEDLPFAEDRWTLAPGDSLLLYTDGVTEATNADGALWGEAALAAMVQSYVGDNPVLPDAVLRSVRAFEAGAPQADDITLVAVHYKAAAPLETQELQ